MNEGAMQIGLVEDNEMVRNSYENLLKMHGLQPTCFESAEALLDENADFKFDCMVIDLRLPGMNGYQLIQKLRSLHFKNKIVLISGNIDVQMKDRVIDLDNVQLLNKPCMPAEFIDVVTQCAREKVAT